VTRGWPPPDEPSVAALHDAGRWCQRLAEVASDVERRAGQLVEQVAADWADARGREWTERADGVRAELGRVAVTAAELGETYARRAADLLAASGVAGIAPGRPSGMRLGGTGAARVEDERGMRIAELPEGLPPA
jgi:hypothetical protein